MYYFYVDRLADLMENCTSLEEVKIHVQIMFERTVPEIGRLLSNHQSLLKLHLLSEYSIMNYPQMQNLCNSLPDEWDFEEIMVDVDILRGDKIGYDYVFSKTNLNLLH